MNKQGFLQRPLAGFEIEWKPLKQVSKILHGYAFKSSKYTEEGIRVIRISDVQKGRMSDENTKFYPLDTKDEIKKFLLHENDIVMSLTGNVGRVAMLTKKHLPAGLNQRVACIRPNENILTRYMFHFFDQDSFESEAVSGAYGASQRNMSTRWLGSYLIPIPPLSIQIEIVRILDSFKEVTTNLTSELTAEITARKQQFFHYREKLLTFDENVELKSLKTILIRTKGTRITAKRMKKIHKDNAPVKIFAGGKTVAYVDFSDIPSKDIKREPSIIVKSRGFIDFEYYEQPFSHKNEMWSYHSNDPEINIKFIYYVLRNRVKYFQDIGSRMQMPQISIAVTDDFQVPIPTLEEQNRIVSILDKFEALTTSLTEGLQLEIELRQKQYEYYRNMLLKFPKEDL